MKLYTFGPGLFGVWPIIIEAEEEDILRDMARLYIAMPTLSRSKKPGIYVWPDRAIARTVRYSVGNEAR
jgi:hypothetical protein